MKKTVVQALSLAQKFPMNVSQSWLVGEIEHSRSYTVGTHARAKNFLDLDEDDYGES
jgi:hypothetical protein